MLRPFAWHRRAGTLCGFNQVPRPALLSWAAPCVIRGTSTELGSRTRLPQARGVPQATGHGIGVAPPLWPNSQTLGIDMHSKPRVERPTEPCLSHHSDNQVGDGEVEGYDHERATMIPFRDPNRETRARACCWTNGRDGDSFLSAWQHRARTNGPRRNASTPEASPSRSPNPSVPRPSSPQRSPRGVRHQPEVLCKVRWESCQGCPPEVEPDNAGSAFELPPLPLAAATRRMVARRLMQCFASSALRAAAAFPLAACSDVTRE